MSGPAGFDTRVPLGWLFVILGTMLAVWGFIAPPELYARSLGINLNLVWGVVMALFGMTCLALARRKRR